jgi:RNA polymerase sigma-70 factor (ECF subfamily)
VQDLPVPFSEPLHALPAPYGEVAPALRLVPLVPLDFDEAVRRIRPRLHRYAVRRLGDVHEAEELVQEALLRAYSNRVQLLTEDDLAAWSTVVTGRLVIDRLRVRGRSVSVADVPENGRTSRDTADVVVARDEARLALDALDAMHPRQAALLWAREVEGQSYDELCTRFGMTEPAVRSVLTRARKALRKEYGARGGTLPVGGLAVLAPWVAGLGWADRLRRVASRITAPAALSAVGITALGGLVLSPFSLLPGHGGSTFSPTHAVVSTPELEVRLHVPLFPAQARQRTTATPSSTEARSTDRLAQLGRVLDPAVPCANDTSGDGRGDVTVGGTSVGGVSAGSGRCDRATSVSGGEIAPNLPAPAGPTVVDNIGITSDLIDCSTFVPNPVLTCTAPTQQGARQ